MKQGLWTKFEARLIDMYREHPCIRFIISSSSSHKHRLTFHSFLSEEDVKKQMNY